MRRILLINQGHTDNLGDQAINAVLATFLRSYGADVISVPYESYVEDRVHFDFDRKHLLPRTVRHLSAVMNHWNRARIRGILDNSGDVAAAVIGGGELLAVSHLGFASALPVWCDELASRGIPIVMTGVSGDFVAGSRAKRFAWALRHCTYVSVRDRKTERILRDEYGIRASYHPDVVFSYTRLFPESIHTHPRDTQLCVPVRFEANHFTSMGLHDEHAYMDYLAKTIPHGEKSLPVLVSSTVGSETYPDHVAQELRARGLQADACTGLVLPEFIDVLNRTGFLLSGRMHACILGLQYGCDVHAIPYREKLAVFAEEYSSIADLERVADASYAGLEELAAVLEVR